jgi:hypothetical protein
MRIVQPDLGYSIQQQGDSHIITYQHKKPGFWAGVFYVVLMMIPLSVLLIPATMFLLVVIERSISQFVNVTNGTVVLSVLALALTASVLILRFFRARRAKSSTITVRPEFLEADGKRYERRYISQIYLKEPFQDKGRQLNLSEGSANPNFVALGASGALGFGGVAASGLMVASEAATKVGTVVGYGANGLFNAWSRSRGCSLWMNYAGKQLRFASRLELHHAENLLADLGKVLEASSDLRAA